MCFENEPAFFSESPGKHTMSIYGSVKSCQGKSGGKRKQEVTGAICHHSRSLVAGCAQEGGRNRVEKKVLPVYSSYKNRTDI